jgi:hypothetical protein
MKLGGIGEDVYLWHKTYESWPAVAKKIAQWHFNHVQLFFVFSDQYRSDEAVHSVLNIPELETVLNTIYAAGAQAILNCTHDHSPTFFGSQAWINDWVALAQKYKGDPRIQAFNLFDEPTGRGDAPWFVYATQAPDWPLISQALITCIDAVRAVDPSRKIMLPFCGWKVPQFSSALMGRGNLIVPLHIWHEKNPATGIVPNETATAQGHILLAQQFQAFANQYGADTYLEFGSSANGIEYVKLVINACVEYSMSFDLFMFADNVPMMDAALSASNYTEPEPPPVTYVLDISTVEGGTTTPTGRTSYPSGREVTVTALAAQGYVFAGWLINNAPRSENPLTLTRTENLTVMPIFNLTPTPPEPTPSTGNTLAAGAAIAAIIITVVAAAAGA